MNSRQYEKIQIAKAEAREIKTPAAHRKLMRHLSRKTEDDLVDDYFEYQFDTIKQVKAMVKQAGWTWAEAKKCHHRYLSAYLNPTVNVYLDSNTRTRYKKMFKKDIAFLFVRDFVEQVYWYPTLDDVVDFIETSAILLKDPDHTGLGDIYFSKESYEESGKIIQYCMVTFSLDS